MPDLADILTTRLEGYAPIQALVGTGLAARIYSNVAKEGVPLPYIVYEIFEGDSYEHIQGYSKVERNRVQIDAYGDEKEQAYELANHIRFQLQGFRGLVGNDFVNGCTSGGSYRLGVDNPSPGNSDYRFWYSRDYFVTYTQSEVLTQPT